MICHTPVLLHAARAELCLAAAPAVLVPRPRPHLLAVRTGDEARAVLLQARVQRLLGGGIEGCKGREVFGSGEESADMPGKTPRTDGNVCGWVGWVV